MNKIAYYIFDRVINNSLSSLTNGDLLRDLHVSCGIMCKKTRFSFRLTHSSLLHFCDFVVDAGLGRDCAVGLEEGDVDVVDDVSCTH